MNRFQRRSKFQIGSATKERLGKKWLPIIEEKRSKLNKMMRLGISLLL
jgi:hypothetical protein